jgi:hypothetical protein
MEPTDISKQLDSYSNAIVAFFVFQGLAFCYAFGTSAPFNQIVKSHQGLAIALLLLFLMTTIAALGVNRYLYRNMAKFWKTHRDILHALYVGKAVVILLFGALPFAVLALYAMSLK